MLKKRNLPYANHNHPVTEEEKKDIINKAAKAYEAYMDALGYDWRNDPNSDNTPHRVAKAFVEDFVSILDDLCSEICSFSFSFNGLVNFSSNNKYNKENFYNL